MTTVVRAEALAIDGGFRGIRCHDVLLKDTNHSQTKASKSQSNRNVLLTGTRRARQGGHDPRYRTSAAFALAVGVNLLLLRVFTFLPS